MTSLAPNEADADRLLSLARAHWGIENKLHWRRDVSMNEDRCRVRAAARPLVSIRNLALAMLRGSRLSVPAAREAYAADWAKPLAAVTGRILRMALVFDAVSLIISATHVAPYSAVARRRKASMIAA